MHRIAILYHSAHGHTEHIARCIGDGIQQVGLQAGRSEEHTSELQSQR